MSDRVFTHYQWRCVCGASGAWQPGKDEARFWGVKHLVGSGPGHSLDYQKKLTVNGTSVLTRV